MNYILDVNWVFRTSPGPLTVVAIHVLPGWLNGSRHMTFAIPMVWREPKDHSTDCYFCLTKISGITAKTRHTVKYPNIPSAIRPVPHSPQLPIPVPPKTWELDEDAVNVEGCADSLDDEERRETQTF